MEQSSKGPRFGLARSSRSIGLCCVAFLLLSTPLFGTARERLSEGLAAEERGEYTTAVQRYREALELNPGYVDAYTGLARSFLELDELPQALAAVREARRGARYNTEIAALEGDILLLLGRIEDAADVYNRILEIEPNNIDARIGLAELAVAERRPSTAIESYQSVLALSPGSRPALLALAVLYDERRDRSAAERYLSLALEHHERDPFVHELAAEYFLRDGQVQQARTHAETTVAINDGFAAGWDLLTRVELAAGDLSAAVESAENRLDQAGRDALGFYLLGVTLDRAGRFEDAAAALERAVSLEPDDEIARYALESTIAAGYDLEHPIRARIAQFRFSRARSYEQENLFSQALAEYRRGLLIDPFSRDGRFRFGDLQRRLGLTGKFLGELQVLSDLGHDDREIEESIELYEYLRRDSIANRWDVDPFSLERDRMAFAVFYDTSEHPPTRPGATRFSAEYIRHRLLGNELIDIPDQVEGIGSAEQAFRRARERGVDYFLVIRFAEQDRDAEITVTIHHADTGTTINTISVVRVGTRRVQRAGAAVAERIEVAIPARGRILERRGSEVLLSIGLADGVAVDDELVAVGRGRLVAAPDIVGYRYGPDDRIGRVVVTSADDLLSTGTVQRHGFFDLFEVGDWVVLEVDERVQSLQERPAFSPLYWRIRRIR